MRHYGRIAIVNGKLRHHETPAFGVSNHLASVLIQAHTMNEAKTSIINLRPEIVDEKVNLATIKRFVTSWVTHLQLAKKANSLAPTQNWTLY